MTMSNIRVDTDLKNQAAAILANFGLSHTQAVKLFFNQIVATRKVPLSFDYERQYKDSVVAEVLANTRTSENGEYCNDLNELNQRIKELN
ncbi:type II toxin-antitoxin system RelB/DinJ family antitoxin [Lonepinella sp. BR2474]|uniref:type II toxin-antitoxin system RelB/DinJ family antitoxin n=1 Tax=Lonepinella sp. BR2474 TaxID=3434548 RepID=UPI003F6DA6D8